jgi:hypothetical protein
VELPRILAAPPDVLSPRMVRVIEGLASDWHRLDERIEGLKSEIEHSGRLEITRPDRTARPSCMEAGKA